MDKSCQNVLHRAPDPSGSWWIGMLVGCSASAEKVAALNGLMQQGIEYLPHH